MSQALSIHPLLKNKMFPDSEGKQHMYVMVVMIVYRANKNHTKKLNRTIKRTYFLSWLSIILNLYFIFGISSTLISQLIMAEVHIKLYKK